MWHTETVVRGASKLSFENIGGAKMYVMLTLQKSRGGKSSPRGEGGQDPLASPRGGGQGPLLPPINVSLPYRTGVGSILHTVVICLISV